MSVVDLTRRPGFRDLLFGQATSSLGDWMATVAFMALVLQLTGSPTAVGGILDCASCRLRLVARWRHALPIAGIAATPCWPPTSQER